MTRTRTTRVVGALLAFGLVAAACGDDDDDAAPATTAAPDDGDTDDGDTDDGDMAASLADVCPSPMVIQTDWFPEAEYGAVYNLVGDGYSVDTGNKVVRGPLWDEGEDTGIEVEVRTGGPAIGDAQPRQQIYLDDGIHLAFSSLDAQAIAWDDAPLVSVVAPLEINPQIIMWDADAWPDVETIADLGEQNVVINVFAGGGFAEVFIAQGIWSEDQVDPSYNGSPARFIADGDIAQQGFASAEPYLYEFEFEEYGKTPAFQLLHDAGYVAYTQTLAVRPDDVENLRECLELFVPIVQRSAVNYLGDPARTNALIVDAVEQYADFWVYDEGVADFAVETMLELGLMGNGNDSTIGNMDADRIEQAVNDIRDGGANVAADFDPSVMFTNEFIDESIGL